MSSSESESEIDSASHAKALKNLKNTDPEFYEFLKENDQNLLKYRDSEEEDDEDEEEEENEVEGMPEEGDEVLENGEESEDEGEDFSSTELDRLKHELQNSPSVQACRKVISTLKKTISKASKDKQIVIINGGLFNEVMKLCLVELVPALSKVLKLPPHSEVLDPSKSKVWKRVLSPVKSYLIDMLKIMVQISESSTLDLVLKHIMQLVPYYTQFVKLSRFLVKKMINVWSTAHERARILAFVILHRVMKRLPDEYHSQILKQMYFAYVRNTKFRTPTSLPLINFMKRSLTEMYACYPETAYENAFLYLRQLCIHLRNALTMKKKESYQLVYNWQFVHCLILWSEVISRLYDFEPIKTLIYPLVQLTIGTINLIPTLKYVPLRFHLIKALIDVSSQTKVFIPIPSLILEVLLLIDTSKKLTFTKKPINLDIALKASKSQLLESGYQDSLISEICKSLMDYFTVYAASITFPELSFLAIHQIKAFLKKNKIAKYGQQLKAVLDKLQQNSNFISKERNSVSFEITDVEKVKQWEDSVSKRATPLTAKVSRSCNEAFPTEPPKKKKKLK